MKIRNFSIANYQLRILHSSFFCGYPFLWGNKEGAPKKGPTNRYQWWWSLLSVKTIVLDIDLWLFFWATLQICTLEMFFTVVRFCTTLFCIIIWWYYMLILNNQSAHLQFLIIPPWVYYFKSKVMSRHFSDRSQY